MVKEAPGRRADTETEFDGVVFDLDGVLVESEHLWEENWTSYAKASGYTWLATDTATVQGMSVPEWSGYMLARIGRGTATDIADRVIDGMVAALDNGRIELLPAAATMVETAAARVPIAVASSAPKRLIEAVLAATGLLRYFAVTVSSEEVPRGKPSPDVFQAAVRRLNLDPRRCLGVEDSNNGIHAAVAAGLTVIALPNPVYPPAADALALCTAVATSAEEVRRYFAAHLPQPRSAPGERRERVSSSVEGESR